MLADLAAWISAAVLGGDGDLLDQPREEAPPLGVHLGLLVLDPVPLRMTRHGHNLPLPKWKK